MINGDAVLSMMEHSSTNEKDVPHDPIIIEKIIIYKDPFEEFLVEVRKRQGKRVIGDEEKEKRDVKRRIGILMAEKKEEKGIGSVGKYIGIEKKGGKDDGVNESIEEATGEIKKAKTSGFGNFDSW